MQNRRLKPKNIDPSYEDTGLFQGTLCQVEVTLIPIMRKNNRGDLVIKGIIKNDKEIAVTFAGRRARQAAEVVAKLNALRDQKSTYANIKHSQLPIVVEGTWRPQFVTDEDGFEVRTYHLIAAKWSLATGSGAPAAYGQAPAHMQVSAI